MSDSIDIKECPVCGGELTPGGVYLFARDSDFMLWAPQRKDGTYSSWGSDRTIRLSGTLKEEAAARPLSQRVFTPYPWSEAWYCPSCQKILAFFQPETVPAPQPSAGQPAAEPRQASSEPAPQPQKEPAPRKEPREKGRFFRRKKDKPDWEL
ncbi:MAG: PF20097 family protein [Clostridiales bacterium]|nr:PF20097 family protein [Clostridiales bacterium]